jgi:hypothetical protein
VLATVTVPTRSRSRSEVEEGEELEEGEEGEVPEGEAAPEARAKHLRGRGEAPAEAGTGEEG